MPKHKTFVLTKTKTSITTALLMVIAIGAVGAVVGAFAAALLTPAPPPVVGDCYPKCLYKGQLTFQQYADPNTWWFSGGDYYLRFYVNVKDSANSNNPSFLTFETDSSVNLNGLNADLWGGSKIPCHFTALIKSLPSVSPNFKGQGTFELPKGGFSYCGPSKQFFTLWIKGAYDKAKIGNSIRVTIPACGYKEAIVAGCPNDKVIGLPMTSNKYTK